MTAEELISLAKEIDTTNLDKISETLVKIYYRGYKDALDYSIKKTTTN